MFRLFTYFVHFQSAIMQEHVLEVLNMHSDIPRVNTVGIFFGLTFDSLGLKFSH